MQCARSVHEQAGDQRSDLNNNLEACEQRDDCPSWSFHRVARFNGMSLLVYSAKRPFASNESSDHAQLESD